MAKLQTLGFDAHSLVADPKFAVADAATGDYRLAPDSPAVTQLGFMPLDAPTMERR